MPMNSLLDVMSKIAIINVTACVVFLYANPLLADGWSDITPNDLKYTYGLTTMGVTMSDVDQDGDDDLIIATGASVGGKTLLFVNDGYGNYTDATNGVLEEYHPVWTPLMGDCDNDGDPDMFYVCFGDQCRLWENKGNYEFTERWGGGILASLGNIMARGGAWVDYNNDGLLDLMVSTNAAIPWLGSDKLLRNVNGFLFQDATPESFIYPRKGRGIAWADFDDDGDQDLYTVGGTGCPCNWEDLPDNWLDHAQNRMFRNDDGILVDVTNDITIDGLPGRGVAAADYDNDGDIDLYICNVSLTGNQGNGQIEVYGYNRLLRNDGDFQFVDVTPDTLRLPGNERSAAWFDKDNDGDLDLLITIMSEVKPTVALYENNNNGESFSMVNDAVFNLPENIGGSGTGCGISDIDNDGDLDFMLGYKYGPNQLIQNDLKNKNKWIKVKLIGTISNRDAIGARVKVRTGSTWQTREIQSGSGYWSQHSLIQHFGLGEYEYDISEILVLWPSGIKQRIFGVGPNQTIEIVEQESLCNADLNNDTEVNIDDLLVLIGSWGKCDACPSDMNADGFVNVDDILLLISAWGPCE